MDALLRKQRTLYASAGNTLSEWASAHAALCSVFAACCSVLCRLRLLRDGALYAALYADTAVPELVCRKQLESLEGLLRAAHQQASRYSRLVAELVSC
jgi:hypothetical protein